MSEPQINRSQFAPESYTRDFPLEDRLGDLLAYAVVTNQLTDEEAELVATALTDGARRRHGIERQTAEYQQWLADVAAKHGEQQRDSQRQSDDLADAALRRQAVYQATSRAVVPNGEAQVEREAEAC